MTWHFGRLKTQSLIDSQIRSKISGTCVADTTPINTHPNSINLLNICACSFSNNKFKKREQLYSNKFDLTNRTLAVTHGICLVGMTAPFPATTAIPTAICVTRHIYLALARVSCSLVPYTASLVHCSTAPTPTPLQITGAVHEVKRVHSAQLWVDAEIRGGYRSGDVRGGYRSGWRIDSTVVQLTRTTNFVWVYFVVQLFEDTLANLIEIVHTFCVAPANCF